MNYEEMLKELEDTINLMESDDIKLEDMMSNYKKAIELYVKLEKYLEDYKKEIKLVTEKGIKDIDEEFIGN